MPSAAGRFEERWKPRITDRLKQSQQAKRQQKRRIYEARRQGRGTLVRGARVVPTNTFVSSVTFTNNFDAFHTMDDPGTRVVHIGSDLQMRVQTTNGSELVTQINGPVPNGLVRELQGNIYGFRGQAMNDTTITNIMTENAAIFAKWTMNTSTATTATVVVPWYRFDRHDAAYCKWNQLHGVSDWRIEELRPRIQVEESEETKKIRREYEAAQRAEQEARMRKYEEETKQKQEADKKAMKLLISCLSPEQQHHLKHSGYFFVVAKSGRKYRIDKGTHGNVKVVNHQNKAIESLCIQPSGVPDGDSMLAQKLMIEHAEEQFRSHANITLYEGPNRGSVIHGAGGLLDGSKLAEVIPIRRAA